MQHCVVGAVVESGSINKLQFQTTMALPQTDGSSKKQRLNEQNVVVVVAVVVVEE